MIFTKLQVGDFSLFLKDFIYFRDSAHHEWEGGAEEEGEGQVNSLLSGVEHMPGS